ncbi:hypothetical protein V8G54_004791 [Vigna mungo]|uniref:Response regulatory domain-containing protein n=1 Tax=Vigna mungo TaxID=3915 RepID=A0AAQ3PEH3_VIGMU
MAGISKKDIIDRFPSNLNILVIDTDIEVLEFIEKTYKGSHQVIICTESSRAVDLLLRKEIDIHLIIMELHMPMMDGYEFLEFLNKEEMDVPLIIMSEKKEAFQDTKLCIMKAIELGACYNWVKPLTEGYLRTFWVPMLRHYENWHIRKNIERSETSYGSEFSSHREADDD